ncbi:MAG: hypothetical protein EOO38_16195 [Cytophagaceae bacterium]|nr:MAG: hypothetical protein EOO38_16195 [Cytophagaceae bacterium]
MLVRILTSCTGQKLYAPTNKLIQSDFVHVHAPEFAAREAALTQWCTPAQDLYTGIQHVRLMRGIGSLTSSQVSWTLDIVSAGYGLISGEREIVPYECTLKTMNRKESTSWANHLHIPATAHHWFGENADFNLVLLGDDYLRALELSPRTRYRAPTLFLAGSSASSVVQGQENVRVLALNNTDARRYSCGLVGLKGEIARRLLSRIAKGNLSIKSLFDPDLCLKDALD